MKFQIATPLSTIFQKASVEEKDRIIELSDVFEYRHGIESGVASDKPRIYHAEESIVDPWSDAELAEMSDRFSREHIKFVTFHVPTCYTKPPIKDGSYVLGGRAMSADEMRANAKQNVERMRSVGARIPMGAENNNYFPTGAYEIVTEPEFLTAIMEDSGFSWLLDIAHAEITAKHTNVSLDEYLSKIGLERVVQLHLSGITRTPEGYKDSHGPMAAIDWENFEKIAKQCHNLQYVTLEYYKEPSVLLPMLERLHTYQS
ncbi:DUF692 family protein [Candidatus Parcubacteria bacterium]|nr:MAG: DUF692 family protein [Candidatus Parcubacteria bacterium]